jgi:hypothetical protein
MAGLGNLGGSLAMTLFGEPPPPPAPEEEATATRVAPAVEPGVLERVRQWLTASPEAVAAAPAGPPEAPVEIQQDPFWTLMGQQMRRAGMPGGTRVLDPGTEAGATGMEAPPASPYERASELATYAGNVIPFSGSTGAKPAAAAGLQKMFAPTETGRASLAQEIAAKVRQQTQRRYRERVVGEPMEAPTKGIQGLFDYGRARGGELWYFDFWPTLQRIAGDEADKFAGVIAALSPQAFAGALTKAGELHKGGNLYLADAAWEAYRRGGEAEVLRVLGPGKAHGVSQDKVDNVLRALRREPLGAADPTEATKIRNFQRALMGDPNAVVLDTWMKKIFYPKAPTYDPTAMRQVYPAAAAHGGFTPQQYAATARVITDFAARNGVSPADVQAALWVAQKYLDQGEYAALGSQAFKTSLRQIYQKLGRDLSVFDDPAGTAKHLALATLVLGGGPAARDMLAMLDGDEAEEDAELVTSSGRQTLEP